MADRGRSMDLELIKSLTYAHRVLSDSTRPSADRADAAAHIEALIMLEVKKVLVEN